MKWVDNHIEVDPPKKPKKLTGTRFAAVLGLNKWSTPFEIWCAVTRTYEKPFEDTIYTLAGKTIEPLQIKYMKDTYGMSNLRTPTDVFGEDYFSKTFGDFFHDDEVFGGMWDSILVDEHGNPSAVLEFKTSKRTEDWTEDIPEYYALQAALYAKLLGVDKVIMVASFLSDSDYEHPDRFVPSVSNTITRLFTLSERYPNMEQITNSAYLWWMNHVETGISPDYDAKKDADIIKALGNVTIRPDEDLMSLLNEAGSLSEEIEAVESSLKEKQKRLDAIKKHIKETLLKGMGDDDKSASVSDGTWEWKLSRSYSLDIDKDALKKDGLYDKYFCKPKVVDRVTYTRLKNLG